MELFGAVSASEINDILKKFEDHIISAEDDDVNKVVALEVPEEIESFYRYYLVLRKLTKRHLKSFVSDLEEREKNLKDFPREFRRQMGRALLENNEDARFIKNTKAVYDLCDEIVEVSEASLKWFDNDEEFGRLVFANFLYHKDENTPSFTDNGKSEDVIKYYVKKTLDNDVERCNFLKCFDDDGNIKVEMVFYLRSLLYDLYRKLTPTCNVFKEVDIEEYANSIITEELINKANEYQRQKNLLKKQEEERIKAAKKSEKEKNKQQQKEKKEQIIIKRTYNELDELFNKLINPSTYSLRKGIDEIVSLDELEEALDKLVRIPKEYKTKFIDEYKTRVRDKRINYILNLLKDNKSLLKRFKAALNTNKEITNIINNQLLSDEFEEYSDEQIVEIVNNILNNNYLKETNKLQNCVIFASNDLVQQEINVIKESKSANHEDTIIKSLQNHLLTLETVNLNEIKSKKSNAFHELMITHNNEYILDNKLKGYRYGARKSKIGVFVLSVNQDNQKELQETYKTSIAPNVILVFGMGHVEAEKESDLIYRMKKYGFDNQDTLLHIYDIFANPFTEETRKEAHSLIDKGILTIQNMNGYSEQDNVKKCTI